MGIRMDQVMGLNDKGRDLIKGCGYPHAVGKTEVKQVAYVMEYDNHALTTVTVPFLEPCVLFEQIGTFKGMFRDKHPLYKYTLRDGQVFIEKVQEEIWSFGPVFFLALTYENGEWVQESLWTDKEMWITISDFRMSVGMEDYL